MDTDRITEAIIGCAITVSNTLGVGFLERLYENALVHELKKAGLRVKQQEPITVRYDGITIGEYAADLLVEDQVILELKAAKSIDPAHEAQLLNYLKATGLKVGLLLNFGTPHLGIKRMVR